MQSNVLKGRPETRLWCSPDWASGQALPARAPPRRARYAVPTYYLEVGPGFTPLRRIVSAHRTGKLTPGTNSTTRLYKPVCPKAVRPPRPA